MKFQIRMSMGNENQCYFDHILKTMLGAAFVEML